MAWANAARMGVVSNERLPEGTVVIELPRLGLIDVELLGSMPEDGVKKMHPKLHTQVCTNDSMTYIIVFEYHKYIQWYLSVICYDL